MDWSTHILSKENRAIYFESLEIKNSQKEIDFFCLEKTTSCLNNCLKNNFSIILVDTIHPHNKLKDRFLKIAYPSICFIDCTTHNNSEEIIDQNVFFLNSSSSLTSLNMVLEDQWSKLEGKKCLFFESGSALFIKFEKKQVFEFIHNLILRYGRDGLVIFKFVEGCLDKETERQLKYYFDVVISE